MANAPVTAVSASANFFRSEYNAPRLFCVSATSGPYGGEREGWAGEEPPVDDPSTIDNQADCEANGYYWYDDACHATPKAEAEMPWLWIILGVGAVLVLGGDK